MRYRSLLVSHWPVASNASVEITSNMFKEIGKSLALGNQKHCAVTGSNSSMIPKTPNMLTHFIGLHS